MTGVQTCALPISVLDLLQKSAHEISLLKVAKEMPIARRFKKANTRGDLQPRKTCSPTPNFYVLRNPELTEKNAFHMAQRACEHGSNTVPFSRFLEESQARIKKEYIPQKIDHYWLIMELTYQSIVFQITGNNPINHSDYLSD